MATWRKRGKASWQVRWTNPDGTPGNKTVHSVDAREELLGEVQRCEDLGTWWQPRVVREEPDFNALGRAWLAEVAQVTTSEKMIKVLGYRLDLIERWLRSVQPRGRLLPKALFSKATVLKLHVELKDFEGTDRQEVTRTKICRTLLLIWKWATLDSAHRDFVPPLEAVRFRKLPAPRVRAVTWKDLDAVIEHSHGRHRDLLVVLRYTGVRVSQAMGLRWEDIDLEHKILHVRGELGKSAAEMAGRDLAMSPHFVAWLAARGRREGYVVPSGAKQSREPRGRDIWRFWKRAGIDEAYWRDRPHHAFRKAFVSCLRMQRVDFKAVEYFVGHDMATAGIYTDPWAYDLAEVAMAIPEIGKAPADPRTLRAQDVTSMSRQELIDLVNSWSEPVPVEKVISLDAHLQKTGGSPGGSNSPRTPFDALHWF